MTKRRIDDIDIHVGAAIRRIRRQRGLSQDDIAGVLGVTAQQVQKYERGENRASGSTLVRIANALDVRVEDLVDGAPGVPPRQAAGEGLPDAETRRMASLFARLSAEQRAGLLQVAEAFAA